MPVDNHNHHNLSFLLLFLCEMNIVMITSFVLSGKDLLKDFKWLWAALVTRESASWRFVSGKGKVTISTGLQRMSPTLIFQICNFSHSYHQLYVFIFLWYILQTNLSGDPLCAHVTGGLKNSLTSWQISHYHRTTNKLIIMNYPFFQKQKQ